MPQPSEKAIELLVTELEVVGKWWVVLLSWEADFVSLAIKSDLLHALVIHG